MTKALARLAPLAMMSLVAGCQALPSGNAEFATERDPMEGAPPIERGLDAEGLAGLLTAELAGQRGDYQRATLGYLEVAERYRSSALTERAALAASFGNDQELLTRAAGQWQDLEPDSEAPARLLAGLAMQRGDWPEALSQRLALIARGGDSDLAAFAEAALADNAEPEPLLALLYPHLERTPPDARRHDAELATALLEVAAGNTLAAQRRLDQLGRRAPELPALWLTRTRLAQERGDHVAARDAARRGLEVSPEDARFILLLAQSELRLGNPTAAERQTDALLDEHTGNNELRLALAQLYLEEGHPEPARRLLLPLIDDPDAPPRVYLLLGDTARAEGEVDNALLYYRQVAAGDQFLAARVRAAGMLVDNDRLTDARTFLRIERLRHDDYFTDLLTLEIELLDQQGESASASELLARELDRTPNDEQLLYLRAMRAYGEGDIEAMERDLGRIIERNPDNAMALNALGYTLVDLGLEERYDEARDMIERAQQLDPDNPAILDSLGWVYYRQGDPEQALQWLERAYDTLPDQEIAAHLAEVLWVLERRDEARDVVRLAIERHDEHPVIDALLERIPQLAP
ncbi:hypothetical protein C1H70_11665 [Halomonas urumqiensis]|uniref:Uncharacterized protein n=2 Tax=Halomonas urumqiensis TaxID=1684789 RepID=A0A2N7UGG9_9GAMM|nr:hypothetical protein C1H70_11665 [Halomonas urumqiensis]PTB01476.1 hypothetical protein C6V82_15545 [Halomonas urumqiensis]